MLLNAIKPSCRLSTLWNYLKFSKLEMATRHNHQPSITRPMSNTNINPMGSRTGTPDPAATINQQLPIPMTNSSHLSTMASTVDLHEKRVSQLPISSNLNKFETHLNSLLQSVSKYQPSAADAVALLESEQELNKSIDDIIVHQQSGLEIQSIQTQSDQLNTNCDQILKGLMECRKSLTSLQSLASVEKERKQMQENSISAEVLLQYAMKLAKFTRVPPTFDANQIGPNNFIWPAEDSLRRGMLAMASIQADKLTYQAEKDMEEIKTNGHSSDTEQNGSSRERRGSFGGSYGDSDDEGDADMIDLDLFDPDMP
ncbi:hypothetical protein WICPIJ_007507 [Wickerhamomyces pijperi]|uniref:Mediator of RNA polymerase II transcription subunit 4 n=1 Tax=Wickerhamomyces pijperi TaxID=599730 RepID=A0A9P8TJV2_WICPI|nr:hypothetical protein WICPIJ_007507 [Wickerhamomyces pijperi]